jgi:hypothetical protein
MLLSPICSLLVIPTLARLFLPYIPASPGHEASHPNEPVGKQELQPAGS